MRTQEHLMWKELKESIYYEDGSFRDLYVLHIDKEDWKKWIEYVNQNHVLFWLDERTKEKYEQIDYESIRDYFDEIHDYTSVAAIFLDKVQINCHFFSNVEIENDIDPREVKLLADHERIIKYMSDISILLQKEVILTPENEPETVLISVETYRS